MNLFAKVRYIRFAHFCKHFFLEHQNLFCTFAITKNENYGIN